ncbi:hypothetical protein DPSP01_011022 [Paraphaeosphaeria sporulosa]
MSSFNPPSTRTYTKDQWRLDKIVNRERETYELVSTNMPHADSQVLAGGRIALAPRCRASLLEDTHVPPAKDLKQDHRSKIDCPASAPDDFLALFFSRLPQELRDLVYTFVHKWHNWPHQPTKDIIIQPPYLFLSHACTIPSKTSPYSPIPPRLHLSPHPDSPLLARLLHDITASFFATHTFWARYRYTPALHAFLSTPFENSGVVPGDCLRRLGMLLGPPDSAEDSWGLDDEESEYGWERMFPAARNGRCAMWRGQLEGDFTGLGRVFGGDGGGGGVGDEDGSREAREVEVYLMDGYSGDISGVEAWLGEWVEGVNGRGGRVGTSRAR